MNAHFLRSRLLALSTGYVFSKALACAAKLEIADKLAEGPQTAADLARLTSCSAPHIERLMRTLCSMSVFAESEAGFSLTAMSEFLRKDIDGSVWSSAVFHGEEMYTAFGALLENVRTGTPAWEIATGTTLWSYLRERPDTGALFDRVMRENHQDGVEAMVRAYDFPRTGLIVDIGGGDGSLLHAILAENPDAAGVLFDTEAVIARAKRQAYWERFSARCTFQAGNFFDGVPAHGDLYALRHILHDWDDPHCVRILRNCRKAIASNGALLVIERVVGEPGQDYDPGVSASDLGMMAIGGMERRASEFASLFSQAGFVQTAIIPLRARLSLIEASPV